MCVMCVSPLTDSHIVIAVTVIVECFVLDRPHNPAPDYDCNEE
jgi:hypothetical protein